MALAVGCAPRPALHLLMAMMPSLALAALHLQRTSLGNQMAQRAQPAGPLTAIQAAQTSPGVEVQIVLSPSGPDALGPRNLHHAMDDIRVQVSEGSRRGPGLKAWLRSYGLDPLQLLPLPSVALGNQTLSMTTAAPERTMPVQAAERSQQLHLTTPWPAIPTSATPTMAAAAAAAASEWTTSRASMRELLATSHTTTTSPAPTRGLEGKMAVPPDAYSPKVKQARAVRIERGPNGVERECSGGLCKEVMGDSGTVLYAG